MSRISHKFYHSNFRNIWHLIWGQLAGFLTVPFTFILEEGDSFMLFSRQVLDWSLLTLPASS